MGMLESQRLGASSCCCLRRILSEPASGSKARSPPVLSVFSSLLPQDAQHVLGRRLGETSRSGHRAFADILREEQSCDARRRYARRACASNNFQRSIRSLEYGLIGSRISGLLEDIVASR